MFDTVIRRSVRLREAAAFGIPVQMLDPKCRAATDFEALAGEVLQGLRSMRPTPRGGPPVLLDSEPVSRPAAPRPAPRAVPGIAARGALEPRADPGSLGARRPPFLPSAPRERGSLVDPHRPMEPHPVE
jgi:hypothetical protein